MLKLSTTPFSITASILMVLASALALVATFLYNKLWPGSLLAALAGIVLFLGMLRFWKTGKPTMAHVGFVLAIVPTFSGPPVWALLQIIATTTLFYALPNILFHKWLPASVSAGS